MHVTELQRGLPAWLPETAKLYLRHVEDGCSIRALARNEGCHASTVLRRVRRYENRRDDPLVDEALDALGRAADARPETEIHSEREGSNMTVTLRPAERMPEASAIDREGRRVLRRLCEAGTLLAVAPDLDKAAVLKGAMKVAVVDRSFARAFALKDWIAVEKPGRVTTYAITHAGRAALRRMISAEAGDAGEAGDAYGAQHREWGERNVMDRDARQPRRMRFNLAESPLGALARRRDTNGEQFLTPDMVAAGERLREDFELAQLGPRVAQNWDRFLTGGERGGFAPPSGPQGSESARERVAAALRELGPGLGDMVLRCCCFLEGLETAEKRLGWSARSGKIVLRIALMRLKRHYDGINGGRAPLIG